MENSGVRVLRSSNINEDKFELRDDDVFVNERAINIDEVRNGNILITSANGSTRLVGKHAIIDGLTNKTVHGGFMLVARSEEPTFVNSLMSSRWYKKFIHINVYGGNGSIGNLSRTDLEKELVYVPKLKEKQKIGSFFKELDNLISLHQRKLIALEELKKYYLKHMFV